MLFKCLDFSPGENWGSVTSFVCVFDLPFAERVRLRMLMEDMVGKGTACHLLIKG